jgi:hypothetical protein
MVVWRDLCLARDKRASRLLVHLSLNQILLLVSRNRITFRIPHQHQKHHHRQNAADNRHAED